MWRFEAMNQQPIAGRGVNTLYVTTKEGYIYGLDRQTGEELGEFKIDAPIISPPLVVNEVVYFAGGNQKLYALDSQTGQEVWTFSTEDVITQPIITNGVVYIADEVGILYAVWAGK
jgi:outer membrane protein assembly factor BamB